LSIVVVDDGFDFKVVLVDERWVVRIPRRSQVVGALEREIGLLPKLAAALPVEVPRFEVVSRDPPFVVYPLIEGRPLVDEDPHGVRAFLEALHGLRTDALPDTTWVDDYRAQCAEFERLVFPLLTSDERHRACTLFAEVETLVGFEPCVVHGDLGAEHLLFATDGLSASSTGATLGWATRRSTTRGCCTRRSQTGTSTTNYAGVPASTTASHPSFLSTTASFGVMTTTRSRR
jgi:aminoglycoside phosphotransferase (APT) family kinase protein